MDNAVSRRFSGPVWRKVLRMLDSNASLLALLLVNFFVLSLIDDRRWGAFVSTLLAAVALVVAISDPRRGDGRRARRMAILGCVVLAPRSSSRTRAPVVGWTYLLPASCSSG